MRSKYKNAGNHSAFFIPLAPLTNRLNTSSIKLNLIKGNKYEPGKSRINPNKQKRY